MMNGSKRYMLSPRLCPALTYSSVYSRPTSIAVLTNQKFWNVNLRLIVKCLCMFLVLCFVASTTVVIAM